MSRSVSYQPTPLKTLALGCGLTGVAILLGWWGIDAWRKPDVVADVLGAVMIVCSIPSLLAGPLLVGLGIVDLYRSRRGA